MVEKFKEENDHVNRFQYRLKVLKSLDVEVKIPSELANNTEIFQNHISNTLRQLKEHELVECINPAVQKADYTD